MATSTSKVADVSRPETVTALVEEGDVIVATVGPFVKWGAAAAEAAIAKGAHYIDSTGEPPFIRDVFERYGPRAESAGIGMITAFGYDWVPGNLAGALALAARGRRRRPGGHRLLHDRRRRGRHERRHQGLAGRGDQRTELRLARRRHPHRARRRSLPHLPAARQGPPGASAWAAPSTSRCRAFTRACAR